MIPPWLLLLTKPMLISVVSAIALRWAELEQNLSELRQHLSRDIPASVFESPQVDPTHADVVKFPKEISKMDLEELIQLADWVGQK